MRPVRAVPADRFDGVLLTAREKKMAWIDEMQIYAGFKPGMTVVPFDQSAWLRTHPALKRMAETGACLALCALYLSSADMRAFLATANGGVGQNLIKKDHAAQAELLKKKLIGEPDADVDYASRILSSRGVRPTKDMLKGTWLQHDVALEKCLAFMRASAGRYLLAVYRDKRGHAVALKRDAAKVSFFDPSKGEVTLPAPTRIELKSVLKTWVDTKPLMVTWRLKRFT
jgi:hypothetical protein